MEWLVVGSLAAMALLGVMAVLRFVAWVFGAPQRDEQQQTHRERIEERLESIEARLARIEARADRRPRSRGNEAGEA